jgi:hypothetical protein
MSHVSCKDKAAWDAGLTNIKALHVQCSLRRDVWPKFPTRDDAPPLSTIPRLHFPDTSNFRYFRSSIPLTFLPFILVPHLSELAQGVSLLVCIL